MATDTPSGQGAGRVLSTGATMPMVGLGVWQMADGPECVDAVKAALELGCRHLDTAQDYGNEASVGQGIEESGVPREDIFLTTKFHPEQSDPAAEAEQSLRRLGVDQVDLYLIHWPQGGPTWAWPGMERALERGYTRAIGVSNFSVRELDALMAEAGTPPAVNQVQFSPLEYRRALLASCQERGVVLEAYSPLGVGWHLANPTVTRLAALLGRTPAQVLLRWCVQHDVPAIPKTVHPARMEENLGIFDFVLSVEQMAELDGLDRTGGTDRATEDPWWPSS